MKLLRNRYRAWVVPYAEGTLDERRRALLEARLAHDPILAAEAEAERRVVARLRDAARSSGDLIGKKALWPGIQSRLEPRPSLVRPLILVGGLSAAAASLAWAALWGPLHLPAPSSPPASVVVAGTPSVIVVEGVPSRRHGHPVRRPRHGDLHLAKRPAPPLAVPGRSVEGQKAPDDARMARTEAPPPTENGGATGTPPTDGSAARFHLATSVRPVGRADGPENPSAGPGPQNTQTPPADAEAAPGPGQRSADGGADTSAPKAAPAQTAARRHTRHHDHHGHRRPIRRPAEKMRTEAEGAEKSASSPDGAAPSPHPVTKKPVD